MHYWCLIAIDLYHAHLRRASRDRCATRCRMRYPKMQYQYVPVDETALPSTGDTHGRVLISRRGSPSLAAYLRICRNMVPNVHHEEVVLHLLTRPFTFVLQHRGAVVGGLTFRMVIAEALPCVGAPRKLTAAGERTLIFDIQLLAVAAPHHGRGFGRTLVQHARRVAHAQARAHGCRHLFQLVQADNGVLPFWRHAGFADERAAGRLVARLNRWRPALNLIYDGATPLGMRVPLAHAPGGPGGRVLFAPPQPQPQPPLQPQPQLQPQPKHRV